MVFEGHRLWKSLWGGIFIIRGMLSPRSLKKKQQHENDNNNLPDEKGGTLARRETIAFFFFFFLPCGSSGEPPRTCPPLSYSGHSTQKPNTNYYFNCLQRHLLPYLTASFRGRILVLSLVSRPIFVLSHACEYGARASGG